MVGMAGPAPYGRTAADCGIMCPPAGRPVPGCPHGGHHGDREHCCGEGAAGRPRENARRATRTRRAAGPGSSPRRGRPVGGPPGRPAGMPWTVGVWMSRRGKVPRTAGVTFWLTDSRPPR